MNLREEILLNYNGKNGRDDREIKKIKSFIDSLSEDVDEFGEDKTVELYSIIFGEDLREDVINSVKELNEYVPQDIRLNIAQKSNSVNKITALWDKVKNFFKDSFSSIKSIVSTGNWAKLFSLPIFKGALAAGGITALLIILKKIFGKKRIAEQESKIIAQAKQAGYKQ